MKKSDLVSWSPTHRTMKLCDEWGTHCLLGGRMLNSKNKGKSKDWLAWWFPGLKIETGLEVKVPFFIEPGETVKVNTETREFAGRA